MSAKIACKKIYGRCDYICVSDWTCTNLENKCSYRGRKIEPSGKAILHDFVKGLDSIEREALTRYLEDGYDKG